MMEGKFSSVDEGVEPLEEDRKEEKKHRVTGLGTLPESTAGIDTGDVNANSTRGKVSFI